MNRTLGVLVLLAVACSNDSNRLGAEAWGVADYAAAGVHVDQPWSADDYVAAEQVVEKVTVGHRERLPRFHGAKSGPVFAKLVAALPDDSAAPVERRFVAHTTLLTALNSLGKLYLKNQMDTPPRESIEITGASLREAVALETDADAFIASFGPDDPSRATRLQGLEKMSTGYGMMVVGGLLVADQGRVPEDDRIAMLQHITAVLPALFPRAKPETQAHIRDVLAKEVAGFPAGRLADAAAAAQRALPK